MTRIQLIVNLVVALWAAAAFAAGMALGAL